MCLVCELVVTTVVVRCVWEAGDSSVVHISLIGCAFPVHKMSLLCTVCLGIVFSD